MDVILYGGVVRFVQGLAAAAPTVLIGVFIAALLRYYLGSEGTRRLFGGRSLMSLPISWLIGMLLPVCSVGVFPVIREMKRIGIRPGSITAFALAAPLFNPLSLLYGLTLSRPIVIIGFAFASLIVVTILGLIWDRYGKSQNHPESVQEPSMIGIHRVWACILFSTRELFGATGALMLVAMLGIAFLGMLLPHGALQSSVEQDDILAPAKMALVAIPIYATPMMAMSQLGMMFAHGNSPGAAFCLLLFGTGVNLATLLWTLNNYGLRKTCLWFGALVAIVVALAYAVDKPLIPPGVEPAGHTHAFDVYTNPFHHGVSIDIGSVWQELNRTVGLPEKIAIAVLALGVLLGVGLRTGLSSWAQVSAKAIEPRQITGNGLDRVVPPSIVGLTCIAGLIALSIVGCYAYYPSPKETLEEMRLARGELLIGATSRNYKAALHWIPILDEWSRRLEVGTAIRNFELRPYQHVQAHLLREKLELLEHEIEHAMEQTGQRHNEEPIRLDDDDPVKEIRELISQIQKNSTRIYTAYSK
jgi:uncharacterized protein